MIELHPWEEKPPALLQKVQRKGNSLILTFSIKNDLIISYSSALEEKLRRLIGEHIGVLMTDSPVNPYCIKIDENKKRRKKQNDKGIKKEKK